MVIDLSQVLLCGKDSGGVVPLGRKEFQWILLFLQALLGVHIVRDFDWLPVGGGDDDNNIVGDRGFHIPSGMNLLLHSEHYGFRERVGRGYLRVD